MGLALVEVVIVAEDAFGIPIPDEDMDRIPTPRALVDYLLEKLAPTPEAETHSSKRAFATLCEAIVHVLGPQRQEIVPSTTWDSLLPRSHALADKAWHRIEDYVRGALRREHGAAAIVGHTAIELSNRGTPGPQEVARLRTRDEIATTVRRLIREKLEVKDFTDDTPFLAMGLD
jgi:hypothetical protein